MDNLDKCLVQSIVQKVAGKLTFLCSTESGGAGSFNPAWGLPMEKEFNTSNKETEP